MLTFIRLYTGDDGKSHIEEINPTFKVTVSNSVGWESTGRSRQKSLAFETILPSSARIDLKMQHFLIEIRRENTHPPMVIRLRRGI